ncbi:cyclopropane mycolic acid synthase family methyltransferase [Mycolicibacter kumamotonensis]|jgi:cyclopropane-fatty-acyl-phospholipid synthase|uniref:Methyltransferase domain-containing protein n=1 Tax=Mycolicibacter kumamotonensis TaxID=354243 RepID=A0A1B8SGF8_9MYCO|nr:cyclopropane mycolic acid synthase family methyltransferase [Mycolicibacter kumamotonensis]NDJ87613.1 methyltransferase domain-containing protein [Mycolicibacter kumamotonensis]OBY31776.1 SAM-dependent methyltransferase [Mycolicibacter kumamotonensis]
MPKLEPKYEELQSIYDISNEFFELFLGPTMGYTCGYYERDDSTCDEAQNAKFDLALGKLDLRPGMTLLDIGCGWGGGMQRAMEKFDVNVIGLTLSERQREYAINKLSKADSNRNFEVRLQGWEEFTDKVDRIVSIGAFEHFGRKRYPEFFRITYDALPEGGRMLLHTITAITGQDEAQRKGIPLTMDLAKFTLFIMKEIFPGGQLPSAEMPRVFAAEAGFRCTRDDEIGPNYAPTLRDWAAALAAHKEEALALQGQEVYDRYDKYLNGCIKLFREGYNSVHQYTLQK